MTYWVKFSQGLEHCWSPRPGGATAEGPARVPRTRGLPKRKIQNQNPHMILLNFLAFRFECGGRMLISGPNPKNSCRQLYYE